MTVKIGSAVIAPGGRLDQAVVNRLAGEIAGLMQRGTRVVVVSSGAVACGLSALGLREMPTRIADRQAAAAAGQPRLMRAWSEAFDGLGLQAAQVLLTADDVEHRVRFVNARRTIETLLNAGVVPIINENDSVAFDEIKLGDNDRLSALTAGLAGATLLVILSKAPGLCRGGPGGAVIPVLESVDAAREHVTSEKTTTGIGGMGTKLDAAAMASRMGIDTIIAPGQTPMVLSAAAAGLPVGTLVRGARGSGAAARKHWIGHATRVRGTLAIDEGARRAVTERGASLLPKGVLGVTAAEPIGFGIGSAVEMTCDGVPVARGLVSYRSDEIARIIGRRSDEISSVLGYAYCDEVVHRDNLIVLEAWR